MGCIMPAVEPRESYVVEVRLEALRIQAGPGWTILTFSKRKRLIDDDPVIRIDGTAKALSIKEPFNTIYVTAKS